MARLDQPEAGKRSIGVHPAGFPLSGYNAAFIHHGMVSLELAALILIEISMLNISHLLTSIRELYTVCPMFFLFVFLITYAIGEIRNRFKWHTGYTRKCFHFAIFTAAAVIQLIWSLPGVMLFGILVSVFVVWACIRGNRSRFYQAIARPKDAPRQTLFSCFPSFRRRWADFFQPPFFMNMPYMVTWSPAGVTQPLNR